jgi:hypothetical protein
MSCIVPIKALDQKKGLCVSKVGKGQPAHAKRIDYIGIPHIRRVI